METIGDAYMVVGGLPIRSDKHAENVCNQALDMLHYSKQVKSPVDGKPINVWNIIKASPNVQVYKCIYFIDSCWDSQWYGCCWCGWP